ncbi:GNAT family N-acetyltransferase [Catenulispora subtropica]|uniref:GNAT family N-acetyltransferase n=1 Tax=Catenulispora subtropica TaxID=450798 RepID=A0ABN2SQY7_9ACTN
MTVDIVIRTLTPSTLAPLREAVLAVAAQAFAIPPWNEKPSDAINIVDRMWDVTTRPDFIATAAFDGPHMIGFTYGYTDDRLTTMWSDEAGSAAEAFEVIELAVAPSYQGLGVGKRLHDALLADAPSPRLLLTHPEAPARHAYGRWGWTEVAEAVMPAGHPIVLMRHG